MSPSGTSQQKDDPKPSPHRSGRMTDRTMRVRSHTIVTHGLPLRVWQDLYHRALTMNWPTFFASLAALFLVLNTAFASLYMLGHTPIANQSPPGFIGAFFFSVETLATVGYGDMHPQTVYAHLVATLEIFVGMSGVALATGLVFARFSRPRAHIMFARLAVVHPVEGRATLMVRAANARQNVISEARARLRLMRMETTSEGYRIRRIRDLELVRDQHPLFVFSWNLMHVIDEQSPLFGETAESLAEQRAEVLVTIEGSDENTAQTMQARYSWPSGDIRWQHRYVDVIREEGGISHVDYTRFHDVLPFEPPMATDAIRSEQA
ncbi:ion channel [Paraburkholderia sp. 2C]|jgi:inward rectifier potassium channel